MHFNTDTWKAYKLLLEADPQFFRVYFTPDKFVQFVRKEASKGVNLAAEIGKKYANLNADNILEAIQDGKPITCVDPFNMAEVHEALKQSRKITLGKLDAKAAFSPDMALAIDVAKQHGYAILPKNLQRRVYTLVIYQANLHTLMNITFDALPGGGIVCHRPGTDKAIKLYFLTIEDFFKSLELQWQEVI